MAQTPNRQDSIRRVHRAAVRHVRLTKRTGNQDAIAIAERIVPFAANLKERIGSVEGAREALGDGFDDWDQEDRAQDRTIGSIGRKAVDWDATHPGAPTLPLLFADQSPSDVTRTPRERQPDVAAQIVVRGATLPSDHPSKALLPTLSEQIDASRARHTAFRDAEKKYAEAVALAEVAKIDVIRQFRDNVIDMVRKVGPEISERCFPTLRATGGAPDLPDETPEELAS